MESVTRLVNDMWSQLQSLRDILAPLGEKVGSMDLEGEKSRSFAIVGTAANIRTNNILISQINILIKHLDWDYPAPRLIKTDTEIIKEAFNQAKGGHYQRVLYIVLNAILQLTEKLPVFYERERKDQKKSD